MPGHRSRNRLPALIVGGVVLVVAIAVGWILLKPSTPESALPATTPTPKAKPSPAAAKGAGTFDFAAGTGPTVGAGGKAHAYRLAVEKGSVVAAKSFAAEVETILRDPRGWEGTFQRVPQNGRHEFTVYLATAKTTEEMCAVGGLHTGGVESCRLAGQIVINLDQWLDSDSRPYLLNHELGHQLGVGHEACPAAGQPAPVMQQQTRDLGGCTPYGWPKKDGSRYTGPGIP